MLSPDCLVLVKLLQYFHVSRNQVTTTYCRVVHEPASFLCRPPLGFSVPVNISARAGQVLGGDTTGESY